jgi:hypothetical protein
MSSPPDTSSGHWERLPEWIRPLTHERRGRGELRLIETTVLVLVGVLLCVASVNDLVRQVHVNHRLIADLRTWRSYTGHDYRNISIEQDVKTYSTRDVLCGNTTPGAPGVRTQICLILNGPVRDGRRAVNGGYYLAPYRLDAKANRYGCFAEAATQQLCAGTHPPAGASG